MYVHILCYKCSILLHVIRLKYDLVFVVFVLVSVASFSWKTKTPFLLPAHTVAVKFTVS